MIVVDRNEREPGLNGTEKTRMRRDPSTHRFCHAGGCQFESSRVNRLSPVRRISGRGIDEGTADNTLHILHTPCTRTLHTHYTHTTPRHTHDIHATHRHTLHYEFSERADSTDCNRGLLNWLGKPLWARPTSRCNWRFKCNCRLK